MAGAVVATAAALAAAPLPATGARLTLICAVLAAHAWLVPDIRAALAGAGMAFLLLDGFLVNSHGELSWDGRASLAQVALLALTSLPALVRGRLDVVRGDRALAAELATLIRAHESSDDQPGGTSRRRPASPKESRG